MISVLGARRSRGGGTRAPTRGVRPRTAFTFFWYLKKTDDPSILVPAAVLCICFEFFPLASAAVSRG